MPDAKLKKSEYVDRDVSWMYFNHRILQEAWRKEVPTLERVGFLGIYSNNLDEFFRVRMASLSRVAQLEGPDTESESKEAARLFKRISQMDSRIAEEYHACMRSVTDTLSREGIHIVDERGLSDEQEHFVRCEFRRRISGFVAPVWLSELEAFAEESDSHVHLAVELLSPGRKPDYALIELPTSTCGRFLTLPERDGEQYVMYLDDVVRYCLPMIFPGMGYNEFRAYSFKFTKDAEMEIDNDLHAGTVEKIAKAVKNRKKGATLRVLHDATMPPALLRKLMKKLRIDKLDSVQPTGRYQNHKDLMSFPSACRPDLKYEAWPAAVPRELKGTGSLLAEVERHDRLLQVPYETFDYVIRLLQEAAVSKRVKSIKITLYRLARNSKIVEALKCAARNGKKVTAVVELLARFDESSNIHYAKEMQAAGVNVVFGVEGLKIHSKTALITLRDDKQIAIVGTGNFHEGNARVYTDCFLMTSDSRIVSDVEREFDVIKRPFKPQEFEELLVSPFNMRERFYALIDAEIAAARKGREAWIKIKINHITDPGMVARLYKASRAGVQVDILVRGNSSLVTGVPGLSENITAAGIIDRYLEHARIFIFCHGGQELTYMGSADWMPRNLDRRIEVVTPVHDARLKAELRRTVDYGLRDNVQARVADGSGANRIRSVAGEEQPFRSQLELHKHYADEE